MGRITRQPAASRPDDRPNHSRPSLAAAAAPNTPNIAAGQRSANSLLPKRNERR
jgi:hypothetical protein